MPSYRFETPSGNRIGEIRPKITTCEIYDADGLLEAKVSLKEGFQLHSIWLLADSSGALIAQMKGNFSGHDYIMETPNAMQIAQIHKKWVTVHDSYGVTIANPAIDTYLILAFAIAVDQLSQERTHAAPHPH